MPRPLRFYGESHSLGLYCDSANVNALLGVGEWHHQHYLTIGARTKRQAAQIAGEAGINLRERDLRIMTGNAAKAMEAEGLLVEGAIFVSHNGQGTVLRVLGHKQYEIVGKLECEPFRGPLRLERA